MGRKCLAALALILALGGRAWCAESPLEGKKACIYPLVDLSPEAGQSDKKKVLTDAVTAELQGAGFTVIPREQWESTAKKLGLNAGDLLEAPAAISLAQASGADAAISGFYSLEEDKILLSVSCYDARGGALAGGFMRQWRYSLGMYNSLHAAVTGMLSRISFTPGSESTTTAAMETTARIPIPQITFTSTQNGMEVVLAGDRSVGTIEEGRLVLAEGGMLAGTPLTIEKRMAGYHTAWQTSPARGEIALSPLMKKTSFSLEANWTTGQLVGAGAALRWYPIPDTLFASFSLYPFVQLPPQNTAPSSFVLHMDTALRVGGYIFFPPTSPFRMGLSTGFGALLTTVIQDKMLFYTDFYFNVINFWVEWNLPRLSFFVRSEMRYTLGIGPNLLGMNIVNLADTPPITLGAMLKL